MSEDRRLFLLRECYELAADAAGTEEEREILRERAAGCTGVAGGAACLAEPGAVCLAEQGEPGAACLAAQGEQGAACLAESGAPGVTGADALQPDAGFSERLMRAVVSLSLTAEGYEGAVDPGKVNGALAALPDSAEKEYLLALAALRGDRGNAARVAAVRHISRALALAPGDPRCQALAEVLAEEEIA